MPLLDNQNIGFKTQLHENSVMDLTQNFYPGNPECQVLESNRERHDSNHERQNVKQYREKKISKTKAFWNILLDNHYNTTDQRLKLLRTQLEGIPLNKSFPLQTEQQELKLK